MSNFRFKIFKVETRHVTIKPSLGTTWSIIEITILSLGTKHA